MHMNDKRGQATFFIKMMKSFTDYMKVRNKRYQAKK
jgi:hypothetical protein